MTDWAQQAGTRALREVPDPYYGGSAGFERVLDLLEESATGLLRALQQQRQQQQQR
jgi:protein-tyrosine phosphatase